MYMYIYTICTYTRMLGAAAAARRGAAAARTAWPDAGAAARAGGEGLPGSGLAGGWHAGLEPETLEPNEFGQI